MDEGIQMVMDDRVGEDYPLAAVKKVIKSYEFQN